MRTYSDLTTANKILAILAATKDALTLGQIKNLGGLKGISDEEFRLALEEINDKLTFSEEKISLIKDYLPQIFTELGIEEISVHDQIANSFWEDVRPARREPLK